MSYQMKATARINRHTFGLGYPIYYGILKLYKDNKYLYQMPIPIMQTTRQDAIQDSTQRGLEILADIVTKGETK